MSDTPTHSGRWAFLGALVAIYGAVTQPSVANAIGGKTGAVLNAIRFLHPVLTAAVGSLGAVTAAAAMPPGSPKQ
jgi:hypothetical protein